LGRPIPGAAAPPGRFLLRPDPLLLANATFRPFTNGARGGGLMTGDFTDDVPPEQPEVASGDIGYVEGTGGGCDHSNCGNYTRLEFTLGRAPTDDHTPSEILVYGVYLGSTPEEAASAPAPIRMLHGSNTVGTIVDDAWADSDAFLAISAYDMAGNESPRSAPVRVNAEQSSCAFSRSSRRRGFPIFTLAVAALGCVVRRLTKRRR
jgi:hypothetical protein